MYLYCLIGNPVKYSLSCFMFNIAFRYFGYDSVYFSCFSNKLLSAINFIKSIKVDGVSVTTPYKSSIIKYLNYIEPFSKKILTINTVIRDNTKLIGYNFDCDGALKALSKKIRIDSSNIAIIGAGSVAKAIGYGIKKYGGSILISNRTTKSGKFLALSLNADYCNIYDLQKYDINVLINATPIGMFSNSDDLSIPKKVFNPLLVVMDVVYNPINTNFLKLAKSRGCSLVYGLEMFLQQGALQFESLTNIKFPVKYVRKKLLRHLSC